MTKLGVEISNHKTHVSKDTYEFAKRWIRKTQDGYKEISPLPLKGISKNIDNPFIVYTILFDHFQLRKIQTTVCCDYLLISFISSLKEIRWVSSLQRP